MSTKARGIDAVYFSVRDVPAALAFYRALLDVRETSWESEHGGELVLADGSAFGVGRLPEHHASGTVLFAVDDVAGCAAVVVEHGGTLNGELRDLPHCSQQWCSDPDGNAFVLHRRN